MANQLSVEKDDLARIEKMLSEEKQSLSKEDQALLEAMLAKVNAEKTRQRELEGADWVYNIWTYRF